MEFLFSPPLMQVNGQPSLTNKVERSQTVCECLCERLNLSARVFTGWNALRAYFMCVILMHFFCPDISTRAPQSGEPKHQGTGDAFHCHVYLFYVAIYQFLSV